MINTSNIEPSKTKISHELLGRPYVWLTAAAFWELIFISFSLMGHVSSLRFSLWMEVPGAIRPAVSFAPSETWIPFLLSDFTVIAGGVLILIKRRVGLYLSIAGLSAYLAYFYIYWQIVVWGQPNVFYGGQSIFLVIFSPAIALLLVGWKKVKW